MHIQREIRCEIFTSVDRNVFERIQADSFNGRAELHHSDYRAMTKTLMKKKAKAWDSRCNCIFKSWIFLELCDIVFYRKGVDLCQELLKSIITPI